CRDQTVAFPLLKCKGNDFFVVPVAIKRPPVERTSDAVVFAKRSNRFVGCWTSAIISEHRVVPSCLWWLDPARRARLVCILDDNSPAILRSSSLESAEPRLRGSSFPRWH